MVLTLTLGQGLSSRDGAEPSTSQDGLRIGELAELAGTTTRTIRHYHATGLLAEPGRDDSGYRRYGSEHLVRLVRTRRLRTLGMPLDQIAAGLSGEASDPGDLRTQLRALADDLERQIAELQALRTRVLEIAEANTLREPLEWLNHNGTLASPYAATSMSAAKNPTTKTAQRIVPGAPDDLYWALGLGPPSGLRRRARS